MTRCIHFTGLLHETCEKGHRYDFGQRRPYRTELPCFQQMPPFDDGPQGHCQDCRFPTKEEREAAEEEAEEHLVAVLIVRALILDTGKDSGEVDCSTCGKKVSFSKAPNGHIRAVCETPGCIRFME